MPGSIRAQWGWHRLTDRWAEDIVREAKVSSRDLVLDVGAGNGAFTAPLLATGARVIAIELHEERAADLYRRFSDEPNLKVVRADASDLWLPGRPFRVVANPPFSITAALLNRLLGPGSKMTSAHLVLQHDAARRWAASLGSGAKKRGHEMFSGRVDRALPRSAFSPRPRVDVAVLSIVRIRTEWRSQRRRR